MGRAARVFRDRVCGHCRKPILSTAKQLANHAWLCKRVTDLGLVMPGVLERPAVEIIRP